MSAAGVWLAIALMTLATVITRSAFFLFGHRVRIPPRLQHALRYAPAAALAAIVAPELLLSHDTLQLSWSNPKLMAGVAAVLFFLATRHFLGTIVVGMVVFSLLRIML